MQEWVHNGQTGERIVFTTTTEASGGDVLAFDFYAAPSGGVPFEHYHARQVETLRVIRGEIEIKLNGTPRTLRAGEQIVLQPGARHSLINHTDEEVYCQVEYRPAGHSEWWFKILHPFQHQVGREPTLLELAPFLSQGVETWPASVPRWLGLPLIAVMGLLGRLLGKTTEVQRHVDEYFATRPGLQELTNGVAARGAEANSGSL